jgi:hypothetical protein
MKWFQGLLSNMLNRIIKDYDLADSLFIEPDNLVIVIHYKGSRYTGYITSVPYLGGYMGGNKPKYEIKLGGKIIENDFLKSEG